MQTFKSFASHRLFVTVTMVLFSTPLHHCATYTKHMLYGTKAKYAAVIDGVIRKTLDGQSPLHPPNCQPIQVNTVIRHGYRYPSLKDMEGFEQLHASKIKGNVKTERFRLLNEWSSPFDKSKEKHLAALGTFELNDIGARFQKHLLKFSDNVTPKDLKLIASDRQRTVATAEAFLDGILGEAGASAKPEEFKIHIDDKLLRFYDFCPMYLRGIKNNRTALAELYKFKEGALMKELARNVTERLGLSKPLETGELKLISLLAAFEEAIYGSSLWEDVLTVEEIDIIEYGTDLKTYWRKAYGYELNYIQSCPLIKDIFSYMEEAIEADFQGNDVLKGVFRFGHAETVIPLVATMGLFKPPVPLTADNYHDVKDREFRASFIAPMSANVAIVLYSCNTELNVLHDVADWPREFSQYMVQVLVNEQVMKLPFCEHTLCPYETFQEHFSGYVDNCRFKDMCSIHSRNEL